MILPPTEKIREAIENRRIMMDKKFPKSESHHFYVAEQRKELVEEVEDLVESLISIGALKEEKPVDVIGLEKELREEMRKHITSLSLGVRGRVQHQAEAIVDFCDHLLSKYFTEEGK